MYGRSFQLTSSRRGWQLLPVVRLSKGENFNSHPHEEDDVLVFYKPAILVYFNSHPHEEDDESYRENPVFRVISTHILTKRMTRWKWLLDTWPYISTHILTKRMTKLEARIIGQECKSRWPPHQENNQKGCLCIRAQVYFNSHPHEEDDKTGSAH